MVYLIATTTTLKVLFVQLGLFFRLKSYWFKYSINKFAWDISYCFCMARFLPLSCFHQETARKNPLCCFSIKYVWTFAEVRALLFTRSCDGSHLYLDEKPSTWLIVSIQAKFFRCCFSILRYLSGLDRFLNRTCHTAQKACALTSRELVQGNPDNLRLDFEFHLDIEFELWLEVQLIDELYFPWNDFQLVCSSQIVS